MFGLKVALVVCLALAVICKVVLFVLNKMEKKNGK